MTQEDLDRFRAAWVAADGDSGEESLRMCFIDFAHAGRYSVSFRNQGFDPASFGGKKSRDGSMSAFAAYVTSPDVYYYDAEFKSESLLAYDVALWGEAFRKTSALDDVSEGLDDLFDSALWNDLARFSRAAGRLKAEFGEGGSFKFDTYDYAGIVGELSLSPAS